MAGVVTSASKQRSLWILVWAAIPVVCLAGWVQVTGSGIDLLIFATACLILLTMERTVGDWLGELLGAALAGFLFAVLVAGTIYYFFSDNAGRSHTDSFFLAAEKRGYRTTYYQPALPDGTRGLHSPVPGTAAAGGRGSSGRPPTADPDKQWGSRRGPSPDILQRRPRHYRRASQSSGGKFTRPSCVAESPASVGDVLPGVHRCRAHDRFARR